MMKSIIFGQIYIFKFLSKSTEPFFNHLFYALKDLTRSKKVL